MTENNIIAIMNRKRCSVNRTVTPRTIYKAYFYEYFIIKFAYKISNKRRIHTKSEYYYLPDVAGILIVLRIIHFRGTVWTENKCRAKENVHQWTRYSRNFEEQKDKAGPDTFGERRAKYYVLSLCENQAKKIRADDQDNGELIELGKT